VLAVLALATRVALVPPDTDAIDSVAVLPFANDTNDPDSEYLSDGITDSVINSLSQLPNLRVAARSTVFRYKGQRIDPQQIGRELGVRAVLSGRLLQREGRLIVRSELMDVSNGSHLWGGESSSTAESVFELQSHLSTEISDRLRLRLTGEQRRRLAQAGTLNSDAYRLYLRGRHEWHTLTPDGMGKAIGFFSRAVEEDPDYAMAYAGMADAYNAASFLNLSRPRDLMPRAAAAARRALEIDPTLAEAHISLGYSSFTFDWDYDAATRHFGRARELNPAAVENHRYYSFYLAVGGRHVEAVAAAERTLARDPISASSSHTLAVQLALAGRFEDAIRECERTIELDGGFDIAHQLLAASYAARGLYREALPHVEKAWAGNPNDPITLGHLGHIRAALGERQEALRVAGTLEAASRERYVPALAMAMVFTGLDDRDRAFAWLERAYEERSNRLAYLRVEPLFASLRPDPRFDALLTRIGLPR
jgi:TolB-like protein/Tfp pilus assembly protein PilF